MRTLILSIAALLAVPVAAEAAPCSDPEHNPIFADVPSTHPLCAQIESLYRDGVTSGCGLDPDGTRYFCPTAPLTRAAGAMFADHRDPFAQLDLTGRIQIGDHVVNAGRFDTGHYWVQFSRDVQRCSLEGWPHNHAGPALKVSVRRLFPTVNVVEVETTQGAFPLDMWFNVRLHCD